MTPVEKKDSVKLSIDQRADELLSKLTRKEKVFLLSGIDTWNTMPIERLGLPSLTMTDGPHGVRANQPDAGRKASPATSFPTGVAMASSWNPELVRRVGIALGEETRALDCDVLLGPCVNIVRTPLAGRNFESYSEDPYLAARIGVAYVQGVQSQNVGTSLKHYACNNQETERMRGSSVVDERTLREIYLAQFEAIVKEANPWTVMCSYNRINGVYASQNHHLLNEILKGEWEYKGVVVSDWTANHTITESVQGGLDLEMPGPAKYYGRLLLEAVHHWQIEERVIDEAVRRILRMIIKSGKYDHPSSLGSGSLNSPEHQKLAQEVAEESATLLKNEDGILPLKIEKLRSIAVIGPAAADFPVSGGGSSCLEPPYRRSPLEGLKSYLGERAEIRYEKGCDNHVELPILKGERLIPARGSGNGLWVEYFSNSDFAGSPVLERVDQKLEFWWFSAGPVEGIGDQFSARWTGKFVPPNTGRYEFSLHNSGAGRLFLAGKLAIENKWKGGSGEAAISGGSVQVELTGGKPCDLRVEYVNSAEAGMSHLRLQCAETIPPEKDDRMERALDLARNSDAAIIVVGMPERYETEGRDRPDLELPGRQEELIRAVAKANKNTVVVLICGAPITMRWLEEVPAVLLAYYPGMEGGNAIARLLAGEVNPSGKLTVTYPKKLEDTPTFTNVSYPEAREVLYGEGIFVGYRYYDTHNVEPLFPFGFGLSYTSFEYSDLHLPEFVKAGESVSVSITIKNTGIHAGKEVVQLYVCDKQSSLVRPIKELKGFQKISLEPGEAKTARFNLDQRALSYYDLHQKRWVAEPGEFEVLVGSSSRDIRARASFTLA